MCCVRPLPGAQQDHRRRGSLARWVGPVSVGSLARWVDIIMPSRSIASSLASHHRNWHGGLWRGHLLVALRVLQASTTQQVVEGHLAQAQMAPQMPSRVLALLFVFDEPDDTGFNGDVVRTRRVRSGQRRRRNGDPKGTAKFVPLEETPDSGSPSTFRPPMAASLQLGTTNLAGPTRNSIGTDARLQSNGHGGDQGSAVRGRSRRQLATRLPSADPAAGPYMTRPAR